VLYLKEKGMNKRLYVGKLSYQTTEATLSDLFGAIGEVVSVNLGGAECRPGGHQPTQR